MRACIFIHLVYVVMFIAIDIEPLVWFNVTSTLLYIAILFLLNKQENSLPMLLVAYLEIMAHAFAATVLLGWDYGFPLQILALIPTAFYAPFKKNSAPYLLCTISLAGFLALRLFTSEFLPIYPTMLYSAKQFFYLFNACSAILAMVMFSSLFYIFVRNSQQDLSDENKSLQKLAGTDPLTGMRNRRSIIPKLEEGIRRHDEENENFSLILCDIDNFKAVNDQYGHDCGDYILKSLANLIPAQLDKHDYLSRWGGEEILIMLSGADSDHAAYVAEAIRSSVAEQPFKYNGQTIYITVTIGVSSSTDGATINDMLLQADRNMYRGKKNGKDCVVAESSNE